MDPSDAQAIQHAKQRLRQLMREKIGAMSENERRMFREAVPHNLPFDLLSPLDAPIMGFLGTEDEPDVTKVAHLLSRLVCFPSIDWDAKTMVPVQVDPKRFETRIRRHGIREAIGGTVIDPNDLGAVLVPGLAFDRTGARLGRGGGFYDKFLEGIDRRIENGVPRPLVVGVCFGFQLVDEVPTFGHDQRMDTIVSESEAIFCYA